MVAAKLRFVQAGGGPSGTAGRSTEGGLVGQVVTTSNDDDTDVLTREHYLLDKPRGSALALGVFSTTATGAFTPDADGGMYRVRLTTRDGSGNAAIDIRNFAVPDANGICLPSFKPDPSVPDYTKDEFNFGGQARGWAYVEEKNLVALRAWIAGLGGGATNETIVDVNDANYNIPNGTTRTTMIARNLTANRTILFPPAPVAGNIFTIADGDGSLAAHELNLDPNGVRIDNVVGVVGMSTVVTPKGALTFVYTALGTIGWKKV